MAKPLATEGPVILDSSAIIALLDKEAGWEAARQVLRDHPGRLHMHSLNVCEVLYHARRKRPDDPEAGIADTRALLAAVGIVEHADMDAALVDAAARLKADIARVSLADCFLLALAARLGGTAVTADRGELDKPEPLAVCPIHFIR
jgi:PIN domain nuclease of toxin-antitoxin system